MAAGLREAIFFVMIGLCFTAGGRGGSTLNADLHAVMGALRVISFAGLLLPSVTSGAGGV